MRKPLVAKFYGDENGKIQIHNQSELDAILKEIESCEYKVLEVKKVNAPKAAASVPDKYLAAGSE